MASPEHADGRVSPGQPLKQETSAKAGMAGAQTQSALIIPSAFDGEASVARSPGCSWGEQVGSRHALDILHQISKK